MKYFVKKMKYFCEKNEIFLWKKWNFFCEEYFSLKIAIALCKFVKIIHPWKNPKKILICAWKLSVNE